MHTQMFGVFQALPNSTLLFDPRCVRGGTTPQLSMRKREALQGEVTHPRLIG